MTPREMLLEQQLLDLQLELVTLRASAQQEIGALRAANQAMLGRGTFLEDLNDNLQKRLIAAEVGLTKASALNSSMAAEVTALGVRLGKAEEEARKTNLRLATALAMTRAKVDMASFPLAQWVAAVCHKVQTDLDLDELGRHLAMEGQNTTALKAVVSKLKIHVINKVRAAPMSTKDMFGFLGGLPPSPAIPVPSLPGNSFLVAAAPAVMSAPVATVAPATMPAPVAPVAAVAPTAAAKRPAPVAPQMLPTAGPTYKASTNTNGQGRVVSGRIRRRTS